MWSSLARSFWFRASTWSRQLEATSRIIYRLQVKSASWETVDMPVFPVCQLTWTAVQGLYNYIIYHNLLRTWLWLIVPVYIKFTQFHCQGPGFLCSSLSEAFLCSPRHHKGILKEPRWAKFHQISPKSLKFRLFLRGMAAMAAIAAMAQLRILAYPGIQHRQHRQAMPRCWGASSAFFFCFFWGLALPKRTKRIRPQCLPFSVGLTWRDCLPFATFSFFGSLKISQTTSNKDDSEQVLPACCTCFWQLFCNLRNFSLKQLRVLM